MKLRVPDYFYDFKCIAGDCSDTCCAGWEIVVDDEMYETYKNVKGDFGKILINNITKVDGDNIFNLRDGNCFFLNKEKTCEIYKNLGKEYLCYTCTEFPRVTEEFLDRREVLLSLSCPEASRIMLEKPRELKFKIEEINEPIIEEEIILEEVLEDYLDCREFIFDLFSRKDIDFNKKIIISLYFVTDVQNKIYLGDMDEIKEVIEKYKNETFISQVINELLLVKRDNERNIEFLEECFKVYKDLNHINQNDPLGLDTGLDYLKNNSEKYKNNYHKFDEVFKENLYIFETLITYFIFRYFMKSIFDYDMSSKIKFAIISTLMIKELSVIEYLKNDGITKEKVIEIARIYSKDIEHSDENVEILQETFEREEIFSIEELTSIILDVF